MRNAKKSNNAFEKLTLEYQWKDIAEEYDKLYTQLIVQTG